MTALEERQRWELDKAAERFEKYGIFVSAGASALASTSTYIGFTEIMAHDSILPGLLAIVVAAMVGGWWHHAYSTAPIMTHDDERRKMIGISLFVLTLTMGLSAWPGVTAISGSEEVRDDQNEFRKRISSILIEADQRIKSQSHLSNDAQRLSDRYAADAKLERKSGSVAGGRGGDGPVAAALDQASDNLKAISKYDLELLQKENELKATGERQVSQLEAIANHMDIDWRERGQEFSIVAGQLAGTISAIEDIDLAAPLSSLSEGVVYRSPTANGAAAIEGVQRSVEHFGEELRNRALAERKTTRLIIPTYTSENPGNLVRIYANKTIGTWIACLSIDALPFIYLLGMIGVRQAIYKKVAVPERFGRPVYEAYEDSPTPPPGVHVPAANDSAATTNDLSAAAANPNTLISIGDRKKPAASGAPAE